MVCKQCGAQNADNVKFCSACGARMEDDKVACKSCGQMNAKDATFCAFCGGRTDGQTVCSACGTVHEGKFCPNCGHAEGAAPAPQAAPAPAPAAAPAAPVYAAPAPVAPAPVYAPVAAKAPMNTLQKILSIVGSAVLMLGVLFAIIGLFGIGVEMTAESALGSMFGASAETQEMGGLLYYFGEYSRMAYGLDANATAEELSAAVAFYDMANPDYVVRVTMTQIFGIGISLTTAALIISFGIPAIIGFIKNLTGKENNFGKWAILTIVMFFMGSGMLYALNVYAMEEVEMNIATMTVSYGFNGITKTAIVLGCIGIGVFVATKLFASWKSWLNVKGILRVSFAVVAVIALAFVFTGAKEAAVTVIESSEGSSTTTTTSFFQLMGNDMFKDYVIVTEIETGNFVTMTETDWQSLVESYNMMGQSAYQYFEESYVDGMISGMSMAAGMFSIVVAVLAAVALGKMIKNCWSEEKSGHLGISIVLLIFTVIYVVFASVVKSQMDKFYEGLVRATNDGVVPMGAVVPEVSVTPIILAAVFAVINLGMAIAQKVVAPKPVAPVAPYGYAPVYAAPQNYNNNNMSFGG